MKIAFFDTKKYDQKEFDKANKQFGYHIDYFEERLKCSNVNLTKGYDIVCVFVRDEVNKDIIDRLVENGVKMIALRCAGYNNVDIEAAKGRIDVVRVPAYSPHAIAEFATGLILTLNRKIHKAYNRTREGNFSIDGLTGFDIHDKTVGIIGAGKIAKVLMQILKGFGAKILAYDKYPDESAAKAIGYTYTDLETIYTKSDIISLHCPLTEDTYHLINQETIDKMKKGVMIINTGRGKLIDTHALIEGLKSEKIGSAGLDVYEEEEDYFFRDLSVEIIDDDTLTRIMTFPNVIVTSHQAFLTTEALENIARTTLESINELKEGKELTYAVE